MSHTESSPRAVYVQTNEAGANRLVAFARAADGALSPLGSFPTGGTGDGIAHLTSPAPTSSSRTPAAVT
jgi:hypothetical protein